MYIRSLCALSLLCLFYIFVGESLTLNSICLFRFDLLVLEFYSIIHFNMDNYCHSITDIFKSRTDMKLKFSMDLY